jgi:hypothetical protein
MRLAIFACAMGTFACASGVKAAEVIYSDRPADRVVVERYGLADDDEFVDGDLAYSDQDEVVVRGDRRRTVVIENRPINCGTYKYWDGEVCADARDKR